MSRIKTVVLEKTVWAKVFEALPPESRLCGDFPQPNFWLMDDTDCVLVFLIEDPA